jgi:hypothetical protein
VHNLLIINEEHEGTLKKKKVFQQKNALQRCLSIYMYFMEHNNTGTPHMIGRACLFFPFKMDVLQIF